MAQNECFFGRRLAYIHIHFICLTGVISLHFPSLQYLTKEVAYVPSFALSEVKAGPDLERSSLRRLVIVSLAFPVVC